MSTTISVLFFARKSRVSVGGKVPIYMRITVANERFNVATKLNIREEDWSQNSCSVIGTSEDARKINACLEGFRMKAFDYQREIMMKGIPLTAQAMRNKWLGIITERPRMLLEIFDQHNEQMKALIGKEFSPLTFERYQTSRKHTHDFMKWKYKIDDIDIKKLNYQFITDYEFWLKSVRKCIHNSTIKYLSNFKKIVNICLKNGWLLRDPFLGFKMSKREVERAFLTGEEIQTISAKTFLAPRITQVRDIFLFCCYTGLAYADVKKLTRTEISTGIDGEKWIFTHRQKTETSSSIPLLPPAVDILARYNDHPQCVNEGRLLPVLSNQKMNCYLQEIADACGITKKMTTHTARHTFATTVTLTNGVPIETVSRMLGHRNLKTTQHYAKILDMKVSEDMGKLRAKIAPIKTKPFNDANDQTNH